MLLGSAVTYLDFHTFAQDTLSPPGLKHDMTQWSKQWLSHKIKSRLGARKKLDMDVSQKKEGRYEGGWHSLILSPVQLAFLMAFKITRPPLIPPCRTPSPTFPAPFLLSDPPTTLHAYYISYKGPNKYPKPRCALPTITKATLPPISKARHNPSHFWKL